MDAAGWAEVTTVSRKAAGMNPLEMATDLASKPDNDWQSLMFNPALMQNYNLSVKGGGKYSTYYNSVGYTNQDGVMKGTNYQRYTLQSKQDFKKGIFQAGTNVVRISLYFQKFAEDMSVIRYKRFRHLNNMMRTRQAVMALCMAMS